MKEDTTLRRHLLGLGLLVAAVAACNRGAPPRSPAETVTVSAEPDLGSPLPSASLPSPVATPAAAPATPVPSEAVELKVGSIATVVTNDLRVRSRPAVSDASKKLTPLLQRGQGPFRCERTGQRFWIQLV